MVVSNKRYFVADFETTVYDGQTRADVWASALAEINSINDDAYVWNSIEGLFDYLFNLSEDSVVYFHNLKFDGAYILSYLLITLKWKQASIVHSSLPLIVEWIEDKDMENNTFKYVISDKGQWYYITLKVNGHIINIRDSLKLLPFSVKKIGESFKTRHRKTSIEYKGYRVPYGIISKEEEEYIKNDVLVMKEALEMMFDRGNTSLTIGSCCLREFKRIISAKTWRLLFPDQTKRKLDSQLYGADNADEYVRKAYKGGWCYVVDGKEKKVYHNGVTLDVNSLYPSVMTYDGNDLKYHYPIGGGKFCKGKPPEDLLTDDTTYFFVRIKTRFKIKHNMLPTIQIKDSFMYNPTDYLKTSDVLLDDGEYHSTYTDIDDNIVDAKPEITLTKTDYILMLDHYDLCDTEYLDYCVFSTTQGLFNEYISKYKAQKMRSTGAVREQAKLFLNNLYGKMATGTNNSFKYAVVKDDVVRFETVYQHTKATVYIPIGCAITAYARDFTIRTAQQNYYGVDKPGFIYADTDSIHCDLNIENIRGVKLHNSDFGCWKCEGEWDEAIFTRQKTYIEHIIRKDGEDVEPYYDVKCAGMPPKCKELFVHSMQGTTPDRELNEEEKEFVQTKRSLTDFDIGLKVPSKLRPVTIIGGVVLVDTSYEMR